MKLDVFVNYLFTHSVVKVNNYIMIEEEEEEEYIFGNRVWLIMERGYEAFILCLRRHGNKVLNREYLGILTNINGEGMTTQRWPNILDNWDEQYLLKKALYIV